jgi:hypothetical protein
VRCLLDNNRSAWQLITHSDVNGAPSAATALSAADEAAISADEAELAELKDMWTSREISTREYRQMRKTIEDRITTLRRKTIVRPTVEVLAGLVGPDARAAWDRLADAEEERLNAVLRFLFAAVIIDEHRAPRDTFDYSRIEIEPQPPLIGSHQPGTVTPATPAPRHNPACYPSPVVTGNPAQQTREPVGALGADRAGKTGAHLLRGRWSGRWLWPGWQKVLLVVRGVGAGCGAAITRQGSRGYERGGVFAVRWDMRGAQ